jgi:diguanylate cyclase (GGDEF)-like protein
MIRRWITPAIATLLAMVSIGAVVGLLNRADRLSQAQVRLTNVGSEISMIGYTPLQLIAGLAPASEVHAEMTAAEKTLNADLAELQRENPVPALREVIAPLPATIKADNKIREVLTAHPFLGSTSSLVASIRLGVTAEKQGTAAADAITKAQAQYRAAAATTRTQSLIGSGFAIIALLAGFFVFYLRWFKVRATLVGLLASSQHEAVTDALTGLANRRALIGDLNLAPADSRVPRVLTIYDLDGFKDYNDTFGHLAGDALLVRMGERLRSVVGDSGRVYRMGGDEFCTLVVAHDEDLDLLVSRAERALSESGESFDIGCSHGTALMPEEAVTADEALLVADQRMYQQKASGRTSASRQSADVLLRVLSERDNELGRHLSDVAALAQATAEALGLEQPAVWRIRRAAELHDVGKSAIPDVILNKPGPLDEEELAFMRMHTIIGERIVRAAPSLADVADLVRSSHERIDGAGYPDGLLGEAIPLGARIIAVCDAFGAMTSDRAYRQQVSVGEALTELLRCAGTQFDPQVVEAFCALLAEGGANADDSAGAGSAPGAGPTPPGRRRWRDRGTAGERTLAARADSA